MNAQLCQDTKTLHKQYFETAPGAAAYAPGRVEVLGNHTDYNEGFVLSAAIDFGIVFTASRAAARTCRVLRADTLKEATFDVAAPAASADEDAWANYVKGVAAKLAAHGALECGFDAVVRGNLPIGAGLSSSAALEVSTALALCKLYGIALDPLALAKLCQAAEHDFAGMKCGLLDQMSSLYGKQGFLIHTDFRSLEVRTVPLAEEACFLICNTKATHSLVDSEYNDRRAACEEAVAFFATKLKHPVSALRDVAMDEWKALATHLSPVTARRVLHVVGENERVARGCALLETGNWKEFGALMYESHDSSRKNFENSCRELDFIVDETRYLPGVAGARLSGGGFGGSAIILTSARDAKETGALLAERYKHEFLHPCDVLEIHPSAGARLVE